MKLTLLFLTIILTPLTAFGLGTQEKPINYVAEFKALKPNIPSVGVLPFTQYSGIPSGTAEKLRTITIKQMINQKMFRPFSAEKWLGSVFGRRKSRSVKQIIYLVKDNYVPLDYLIDGNIFRVGHQFGVRFSLYAIHNPSRTTYYFRIIDNLSHLRLLVDSILNEIKNRYKRHEVLPFIPKSFFINPPQLHYYLYSTMENGDFAFSPVPFLEVNKVDYLTSDNYFQDLLVYWFHFTRLATVDFCDIPLYVKSSQSTDRRDDFVVNSSIKMTNQLCLASFSVISGESGSEILSFELPFHNIDMKTINAVIREAVRIIVYSTLSEKERRGVGIVDSLDTKSWFDENASFYVDDFYAGASLTDAILPIGVETIQQMKSSGLPDNKPCGGVILLPYANPIYEKTSSKLRYFNFLSQN